MRGRPTTSPEFVRLRQAAWNRAVKVSGDASRDRRRNRQERRDSQVLRVTVGQYAVR